jgi:formamidopyrimidine-DNA glycosylase
MPEISEVRIMSDFINAKTEGKEFFSIVKSNVSKNPIIKEPSERFSIQAESRGKELQLLLGESKKITFTMGMSGNWYYSDSVDIRPKKHSHLFFFDTDGGWLYLNDVRRFAKWAERDWNPNRGPDPVKQHQEFCNNITKDVKTKKLLRTKLLPEIMLNQQYFNGIGNYLRSTILYYANINPFQTLNFLYENDVQGYTTLLSLCKECAEYSYIYGGGQFKDWDNPFQQESTNFLNWVYYKKGNKYVDSLKRTFWYNPQFDPPT